MALRVDRIAADLAAKNIESEIAARQQASALIIAEQGRWYTAIIRPLLALWGARFADVLLPSCYTTWGDTTGRAPRCGGELCLFPIAVRNWFFGSLLKHQDCAVLFCIHDDFFRAAAFFIAYPHQRSSRQWAAG